MLLVLVLSSFCQTPSVMKISGGLKRRLQLRTKMSEDKKARELVRRRCLKGNLNGAPVRRGNHCSRGGQGKKELVRCW